jgi:hypothetical protein
VRVWPVGLLQTTWANVGAQRALSASRTTFGYDAIRTLEILLARSHVQMENAPTGESRLCLALVANSKTETGNVP